MGADRVIPRGGEAVGRFSAGSRRSVLWIAVLAALALAAELAVVAPLAFGDDASVPGYRVVFRLVGGAFVACGLTPGGGGLTAAAGCGWSPSGSGCSSGPLFAGVEPPAVPQEVNDLSAPCWVIAIIALILSFVPAGGWRSPVDRVLVGALRAGDGRPLDAVFLAQPGNRAAHPERDSPPGRAVDRSSSSLSCTRTSAVVIAARWRAASPRAGGRCCRASPAPRAC